MINLEKNLKKMEKEEGLERKLKEYCPDVPGTLLERIFFQKPYIKKGLEDLEKYPDNEVTFMHSLKTADLAYLVGKEREYEDDKLQKLVEAALAHDLGKIKIDPEIINSPEKIEGDKLTELRSHVEKSFQIIRDQGDMEIAKLTLLHHRFKSKGPYPSDSKLEELLGEEILTEDDLEMGNVLALVDTMDAMSAKRSYKKSVPVNVTEKVMRAGFGESFDDDILDILRQYHDHLYGSD